MPMYDINSINQSGIPATKQILKYANAIDQNGKIITGNPQKLNLDYDSLFAIMKQQNMIETFERYMWVNVPFGLTADLIERLLYFRGRGVFYFNDKVNKFQFLPYALNKTIDEYGRYTACNTLPFTGVDSKEEKNGKEKAQAYIYENLELVYDLPYNEDDIKKIRDNKSVGIILNDSSLGISQQPVIRSNYVRPVLHMMATLMQIINAAMYGAADINLIQVENESELASINQQISAINLKILRGDRFIPVIGALPIQPIKTSNTTDLEGLFGTFNSLTNFLKSITGVANAGVFDKKAHLLQEEQKLNGSNSDDIYYNGLRQRQEFCLMVQAYYGYPIWCESKRNMTEAQAQNYMEGETDQVDDTQVNNVGGNQDGSDNV